MNDNEIKYPMAGTDPVRVEILPRAQIRYILKSAKCVYTLPEAIDLYCIIV